MNFQLQHVWKLPGRSSRSCYQFSLHATSLQDKWLCVQPLTKPDLQYLQRNDRAMIKQVCNVRLQDVVTTRSNELLAQLGIEDLDLILKERRLRWYGHVECSNGAVKKAFHIQVEGKHGPGRPKMTWKQVTERDCKEWKLSAINPHDRNMWRSGVRSAMHGCFPCTCMLIKNLIMMIWWSWLVKTHDLQWGQGLFSPIYLLVYRKL